MDLNIISTHENKAIGRKEIEFSLMLSSGAKRADIKTELCKKANLDPKATIIVRMDNGFGSTSSNGIAHSYQSEGELKRFESRPLLERLGIVEKAVAKPAAQKSSAKEAKK